MNYRLLVFKFKYLGDRYYFPIIIDNDNLVKASFERNLIDKIIEELNKFSGIEELSKFFEKVDIFQNLQLDFNSIMGEIDLKNYRTIDVQLMKAVALKLNEIDENAIMSFQIKGNMHLPIRQFDKFNEININPFIIIAIE